MNIKDLISQSIDIPQSMIIDAINVSRVHVKTFTIKKRNGKPRLIYHPSKKLKTIQYWLIHNVFNMLPVHESAAAYKENTSILDNAKKHQQNKYFLKLDFVDFFPSLKYSDLEPILQKNKSVNANFTIDAELKKIIKQICFYREDKLAIGYPSSPIISNIIMYEFDSKIKTILSDANYGSVVYTRYADDITISTDKPNVCNEIYIKIKEFIDSSKSPKLSINSSKTKFSSSTGGSATVTGLRICHDNHITLHRKQKDHIRLLLGLFAKGTLNDDEQKSLVGHLSYCHYVEPSFYSKLSKKYFKEIAKLRESM